MSQTVTLSMSTLLIGVPSLVVFSGAVTFIALRGYLVDAVEGHRLLAANDTQSARWLFLRGYRKSPHAGPDITGEVVHVEVHEPLALLDRPAEDEDEVGDEQPGEATTGAPAKLWARLREWAAGLVADWRQQRAERNQIGSGEQAVDVDPFERFRIDDSPRGRTDAEIRAEIAELTGEIVAQPYEGRRLLDEHSDRDLSYRSRHTAAGYETGIFPAINVPAQREAAE